MTERARRTSDAALEARARAAEAAKVEAARLASELLATAAPADLRRQAVLTIRCTDCKAMPIAYVIHPHGRPAIWCRQENGDWAMRLLDVHHPDPTWAWCRTRAFLPFGYLQDGGVPSAQAKPITLRVSHD